MWNLWSEVGHVIHGHFGRWFFFFFLVNSVEDVEREGCDEQVWIPCHNFGRKWKSATDLLLTSFLVGRYFPRDDEARRFLRPSSSWKEQSRCSRPHYHSNDRGVWYKIQSASELLVWIWSSSRSRQNNCQIAVVLFSLISVSSILSYKSRNQYVGC